MSHVFLVAMPGYSEILSITDAAINIFPDLDGQGVGPGPTPLT